MRSIHLALAIAVATSALAEEPISQPSLTSLVSVLATPSEFHNKRITIIGYVHFEFEGNQVCLRREDLASRITSNCFWLDASSRSAAERDAVQDRYAIINARFSAAGHGHLGMFQGTFLSLERLDPWSQDP